MRKIAIFDYLNGMSNFKQDSWALCWNKLLLFEKTRAQQSSHTLRLNDLYSAAIEMQIKYQSLACRSTGNNDLKKKIKYTAVHRVRNYSKCTYCRIVWYSVYSPQNVFHPLNQQKTTSTRISYCTRKFLRFHELIAMIFAEDDGRRVPEHSFTTTICFNTL